MTKTVKSNHFSRVFFLTFSFVALLFVGGYSQLAVSKKNNTNCEGDSKRCQYEGPSILINEISITPSQNNGSLIAGSNFVSSNGEGEWIELYNPNSCDSVDISGYMLGSYNSTTSRPTYGMGYILPAGTVVPPNGFLVVRGQKAPPPHPDAIDIVVVELDNNVCWTGGASSRFWFQDIGSWFAFYDRNGVPQDAIQWGNPDPGDLNQVPCIPDQNYFPSSLTTLPTFNQIPESKHLGASSWGNNFVRIPDGGEWSTTRVSEFTSYGSCNEVGQCQNGVGVSTCNGEATVNPTFGIGPYTYSWDDDLNQQTQTAIKLCPKKYNVLVMDSRGIQQSVEVEIEADYFEIDTLILTQSCENQNTNAVVNLKFDDPTTQRILSYEWLPAISFDSIANNLSAGTYTLRVDDGNCFDTTSFVVEDLTLNVDFTSSKTEGCEGDKVSFYNFSTGVTESTSSCLWTLPDSTTVSDCQLEYTFNEADSSPVILEITDKFGCKKILTKYVDVKENPKIDSISLEQPCEGQLGKAVINFSFDSPSAGRVITYDWQPMVSFDSIAENLSDGNYNVRVNNGVCFTDTNFTIETFLINVDFSSSKTDGCLGDQFIFQNTSTGVLESKSTCLWTLPDGTQDTKCQTQFVLNDVGSFPVALEITDSNNCVKEKTISNFIQAKEEPKIESLDLTQPCEGEKGKAIVNLLFNHPSANRTITYDWLPAVSIDSIANDLDVGNYSVKVNNGICFTDTTFEIVASFIDVDFSSTKTEACVGEEVIFDNNSTGVSESTSTCLWTLPDGSTNVNCQMQHIFNSAGSYPMTLEITDTNNCKKSVTLVNAIKINQLPQVQLGSDLFLCEDKTVTLNANPGYSEYYWLPTEETTPSIEASPVGEYTLKVIDNNLCENSDKIVLSPLTIPIVDLGPDTTICEGGKVILSTPNEQTILWNTGSNKNSILVDKDGLYRVDVTNKDNCSVFDEKKVTVIQYPTQLDLDKSDSLGCYGLDKLLSVDSDADVIHWSNGDKGSQTYFQDSGMVKILASNTQNGVYCPITDSIFLKFYHYPNLKPLKNFTYCFEFGANTVINSQTKARFNFWDGSRVNSSDHLIHSDGIYSLESYDHPYCKLNQSILVDEKCPLRVFIPNAFTPGGFTNPTFFPVVSNHTKLDFYIYNRWGQLVFKSHSPNDVWDGTFNGKPAQQDIYIWKILVEGYDRDYFNETYEEVGTVALIR